MQARQIRFLARRSTYTLMGAAANVRYLLGRQGLKYQDSSYQIEQQLELTGSILKLHTLATHALRPKKD